MSTSQSIGGGPGTGFSYWNRVSHRATVVSTDLGPIPVPEEKPRSKTFISIDLETTGLRRTKNGICQIGAWATGETEDRFKGYYVRDVNPHWPQPGEHRPVQVTKEALNVNGFTPARLAAGLEHWAAMRDFHKWLNGFTSYSDVVCVGQNTAFDIAWLTEEFNILGLDTGVFRRNVDCYTLSFLAFGAPMGLGKVAGRLGIKYDAHDALSDAWAASTVFHRLSKFLAKEYHGVPPSEDVPLFFPAFQQGGTTSPCVR